MLLALVSVTLNALAQLTIKSLAGIEFVSIYTLLKQWQLYATMLLYGSSIVTWYLALRNIQVSVAYPLQAFGYVLVTFLAWLSLNESITPLQLIGLGIIVFGVVTMGIAASR